MGIVNRFYKTTVVVVESSPSLCAEGDEGLDEDGGLGVDVRAHHDLGAGQGLVRL